MKHLTQEQAIERSYQLSALLGVCEIAAQYIAEPATPNNVTQVGSHLASVLEIAHEFLDEIHGTLEKAEMKVAKIA